jgi:ABC-2 type transport system permease protein
MRHLLLKDLQILRRSPLLLVLMLLYPLVIGLPVGWAVSDQGPAKPRVAFLNEVPPGASTVQVGGKQLDASAYAGRLFDAIDPIRVKDRAEALDAVRSGRAVAALIVPADVTQKLQSAVGLIGSGGLPTLEVVYSADNPLKRRYVEDTIRSQLAKANQALGRELTKVAGQYLRIILKGGDVPIVGDVLGLQRSSIILQQVAVSLPRDDARRVPLDHVRSFADAAIKNLDLSDEVLGAIGEPIRVKQSTVGAHASSSLDGYAVAAAVAVALLFVGILSAAGMLALEREEHAFGRLVRGLVSRSALLVEKVVLGALCATVVAALLLVVLGAFGAVDWGRVPLGIVAAACGAAGFGALGVAIGAVTRDVRAASLLAFLLSLPIAALALVPSGAVSQGAFDTIRTVSAVFPFKPALQALDAALNESTPALPQAAAHLAAVVVAYLVVARVALRRLER